MGDDDDEEEYTTEEVVESAFLILFAMVDIVYICIGVFYLGACPKSNMIPLGNIGWGFYNLCTTVVQWYDPQWSYIFSWYWNVVTKMGDGMWLLTGIYWTYQIFPPDYDNEGSPEYCDKALYSFAMVTVSISCFIYISIALLSACCWCWGRGEQGGPRGRAQGRKWSISSPQPPAHSTFLALKNPPVGKKEN